MPKAESLLTRLSAFFFRHRRLKLVLLLAVPLAWLVGVYLASLGSLLVQSFWRADELSPNPVHVWNLDNYRTFLTGDPVYRSIVARTLGFAVVTTLVDVVLAFPLAYYLTRVASPRTRRVVLVLVTVPLFSSLIVRLYSVRLILDDGGILHALLAKAGLDVQIGFTEVAMAIAFAYVWLPFMILPVYAALERVPGSLIEASRDLGAKGSTTFRTVVLPLAFPGRRGRLDLHVLAHARRLHHAHDRRRRQPPADRLGRLQQLRDRQQRARSRRRSRPCRSRSWPSTC